MCVPVCVRGSHLTNTRKLRNQSIGAARLPLHLSLFPSLYQPQSLPHFRSCSPSLRHFCCLSSSPLYPPFSLFHSLSLCSLGSRTFGEIKHFRSISARRISAYPAAPPHCLHAPPPTPLSATPPPLRTGSLAEVHPVARGLDPAACSSALMSFECFALFSRVTRHIHSPIRCLTHTPIHSYTHSYTHSFRQSFSHY